MAETTLRKARIPAAGILGAGAGAAAGELTGETVARASAQTGWWKVGVKAAVKGGLCALFYGISTRLPGLWSLGFEIAGYSSFGAIIPDVILQLIPGGLWGIAEAAATSLRTWAIGVERVKKEIEDLESGKGAEVENTWI